MNLNSILPVDQSLQIKAMVSRIAKASRIDYHLHKSKKCDGPISDTIWQNCSNNEARDSFHVPISGYVQDLHDCVKW